MVFRTEEIFILKYFILFHTIFLKKKRVINHTQQNKNIGRIWVKSMFEFFVQFFQLFYGSKLLQDKKFRKHCTEGKYGNW